MSADPEGSALSATRWWLDPALAKLAFGSQPGRRDQGADAGTHLAFLPTDVLELDLTDPAQCELGDYVLKEQIGQGGMGVVYRAWQRTLEREVAVKLLSTGPWASDKFIAGFRREARNAASLQHPNIVAVYEMGEQDGLVFYAMRLVRGSSLAEHLRVCRTLPPREAATMLRTVAEAVDYAHRLGVLHLDLKPGNILLDEQGVALVTDFGLARRLGQAPSVENEQISGTPSYMAPEQAQVGSSRLSVGTDIWGMGAILYEMLTGDPPFTGRDAREILERVVSGTVRQLSRRGSVPPDLEAIALKCLSRSPENRYPSARELADDLGRFLEHRSVQARPLNVLQRIGRWAQREPQLAIASAMAAAALVTGLVATTHQWRRAEGSAAIANQRLWEGRRETALQFEREGNGFEALPRLLANIGEQQLSGHSGEVALEHRRIGMMVALGATLIDRTVIADANPLAIELSPDGSLVAVAMNDRTVRWFDAGTLTERGRVDLAGRASSDGEPRPVLLLRFVDSHRLLATFEWYGNLVSPSNTDSWLIDLDGGRVIEPPAAFADFADASFSANGRFALLRNHDRRSQLWQVHPWRPLSGFSDEQRDFLPWMVDPQGRYVAMLSVAMRKLRVFPADDLASAHVVDLPTGAGISAWSLDSSGSVLALGDFEGRLYLLDMDSLQLRTLPVARGSEISWLGFSEDDAWLATASNDGNVRAFDVASGDSLTAGQMGHDYAVQRVGISRTQRILVVAGEGRSTLWRLPIPGPRAVAAQRVGLAPAPHALTGRYPIGWSLASGLLVTAGFDGHVRLWRLPAPPGVPALAAPQIPERTWFHTGRVVDVAWNRVRIASPDGVSITPWLDLEQPPGFAELLDDGRLLVLSVGPELRLYDARHMTPLSRPIPLPASPARLVANADGSRIVLSFGDFGPEGFRERLLVVDGRGGKRLPGENHFPGQLRRLVLSPDGTRLLAVGAADAEARVFELNGLGEVGSWPHDPFEPVVWADFAADGHGVLLVTRAPVSGLGTDTLIRWNPDTADADTVELPAQTGPLGVVATRAGTFVSGLQQDLLLPPDGTQLVMTRMARSSPVTEIALSRDGTLLARAFQREVQLFDLASGTTIGPPLQADGNAIDAIAQLAFSADGSSVLARTLQGHWLVWPIAAPAAAAHLTAALPALRPEHEDSRVVYAPSAAERAELRSDDPGAWPALPPRPQPATVVSAYGTVVPARVPGTPEHLLDLSSIYNFAPDAVRNPYHNIRPIMRPLPVGILHLRGRDYETRGMAQIGIGKYTEGADALAGVHCLPLPARPIAAVHPLLIVSARRPLPTGHPLGTFTLRFGDGSQVPLSIRAGQELRGYSGDDAGVPLAFAGNRALALFGEQDDVLVAPRLVNPHPERIPRCLDIAAADTTLPVLLFAVTLEPAAANADGRNRGAETSY